MERDVVFEFGVTAFTSGDLRFSAIGTAVVGAWLLFPWAKWQFQGWRIRRAVVQGRRDDAEFLTLNRDEGKRPKSPLSIIVTIAFIVVAFPALIIFQENFADDVGRLLGEGFEWAGMLIAGAFVAGCAWMWDRFRRNLMSPEELAELEEEEEYQRWVRSIEGDGTAAVDFGIAGAIVVLTAIVFFILSGLPN